MHRIVKNLCESLQWAIEGPSTDNELMKRALRPVDLSPWGAWTLLSLVAHTERQRWVTSIVQTKLQGSPEALAGAGAFAHPEDVPQRGVVPGIIDWEYYFHGRGCCLTNRRTGESIDVDFFDDSGDWIDPWFYGTYLSSLKIPGPVEHRLLQLHAPPETVQIAIDELIELQLLTLRETSSKIFRVSEDAQQLLPLLEPLGQVLSTGRYLDSAIAVGDWLLAADSASSCDPELRDSLDIRAIACKDERIRLLLPKINDYTEALPALCALNPPELAPIIRQIVRGSAGGTLNRALDHLAEHADANWLDDLYALFARLPINGDIPVSHSCVKAASILLKRGHRVPEVIDGLRQANNRELAEIALLMLEYAPQFARELFHKALRSRIPIDRQEASAILAVLSEPWCRDELCQALADCRLQSEAAPLRAALTSMTDSAAHNAALAWERKNPYVPEPGPFYTWEHVAVNSADSFVQYQMDKLHERVLPLRGRVI